MEAINMKYEYKRVEHVALPSEVENQLKLYGSQGWELISYKERDIDVKIAYVAVFKRNSK